MDDDYRIIIQDLPSAIQGFITKDPDGYSTIVLNGRYTSEEQKQTAIHELWHKELHHLDDLETSVQIKEDEVRYRVKRKMLPSAATDDSCKD